MISIRNGHRLRLLALAIACALFAFCATARFADAATNTGVTLAESINAPGSALGGEYDFPLKDNLGAFANFFVECHGGSAMIDVYGSPEKWGLSGDHAAYWAVHPERSGLLVVTSSTTANNFEPFPVLGSVYRGDAYQAFSPGICPSTYDAESQYQVSTMVTAGSKWYVGIYSLWEVYYPHTAGWDETFHALSRTGTFGFNVKFYPDTDADGMLDRDENCEPERVSAQWRGCTGDSDIDGQRDSIDKCPLARAVVDRNRDGCEDPKIVDGAAKLTGQLKFSRSTKKIVGGSISAVISELQPGTTVKLTCKKPKCGNRNKTVMKTGKAFNLGRPISVKPGKRIIVTISRSGMISKRITWRVGKRSLSKSKQVCMVGLNGPQKACKEELFVE